jgi:hypothetical protein
MINIHQRPLPETRTPENSCTWVASAEIDGIVYLARSRRGAAHELARALAAAGLPDQSVRVEHDGLAGYMSYRSLHRMAGGTYVEGRSTVLARARYREDERFAASAQGAAQAVALPGNAVPEGSKNALQQPADIAGRPAGQPHFCAHCAEPFIPSRSWALHCSPRCRVSAHRAKLSAAAELAEAAE